jgi:hypothetical protein
MFVAQRRGKKRGLRGLGTISTPVGTSLVFSSNPIARTATPVRGTIAYPTRQPGSVTPVWGAYPPRAIMPNGPGGIGPGAGAGSWAASQYGGGWSAANNPYGSTPQNPQNSQALAAAQALLASNPSLLTPQQFAMLQAAGLVSNTLPFSSASQIPSAYASASAVSTVNDQNCIAAGCTGGPYPNCTCAAAASSTDIGTMLDTTYGGLPLYLWLLIAGGGLFLLTSKRGR